MEKSPLNFKIEKTTGEVIDMAADLGLWVDDFRVSSPEPDHQFLEIPSADGARHRSTRNKTRKVTIDFTVETDDIKDFDDLKHRVFAAFFSRKPYKVIRELAPERMFYALQDGAFDIDNITPEDGEFSIDLIIPSGDLFGSERTQTIAVPPATFNRDSVAYDAAGNQVAVDQPRYKVVGKNLLPPFSEWDLHPNATVISDYELRLDASANNQASQIVIQTIPDQSYTFSTILSANSLYAIVGKTNGASLLSYGTGTRTFNSGKNSEIYVYVSNVANGAGIFSFTNPQLEEGSTATPFEPMNRGVLIEEGTTNLAPTPLLDRDIDNDGLADGWSQANSDSITSTRSIDQKAQRTDITASTGSGDANTLWDKTVSGGQVYSVSVEAKVWNIVGTGRGNLRVITLPSGSLVKNVYFTNTDFQTLKIENIVIPTNDTTLRVGLIARSETSGDQVTTWYKNIQLEQKPYATSFIDGTRSPETLDLKTANEIVNPEKGSLEFQFYANDLDYSTGYVDLLDFKDVNFKANRFIIVRKSSDGTHSFYIRDGNSWLQETQTLSNTLHTVSFSWEVNGKAKIFLDGVFLGSVDYELPDRDFNLISTVGGVTLVSNLRISSIARTDEELANPDWSVDEYTTAYLDFEGQLQVQTPKTVSNPGTAETFPVVTAKFFGAADHFKVANAAGEYVNINWDFVASDLLEIDFAAEKIKINGNVTMTALDWANSDFFVLENETDLVVDPAGVAVVDVVYTPRFL